MKECGEIYEVLFPNVQLMPGKIRLSIAKFVKRMCVLRLLFSAIIQLIIF